ncbi:hypothetical protein GCM10022224_007930 [Nonomuraea antimicrobica]|uniref:Uncharacterized protein n=1 Tax=Nonomuraea antimicrobica TaxID=561173 RepID=A0ABP7B339_9ACTN
MTRSSTPALDVGQTPKAWSPPEGAPSCDLSRTQRLVEQGRPAGTTHFLGWETLTHADHPA